jgi:hypothetical protein
VTAPQVQSIQDQQIVMILWNEIFFLRGLVRRHVEKAIEWQEKVVAIENAAEVEGPRRAQGRMERKDDSLNPSYTVASVLEKNFEYKVAVGNRNSHQAQANMFSAALTALVSSNPPLGDFETPGMEFFVPTKPKSGVAQ